MITRERAQFIVATYIAQLVSESECEIVEAMTLERSWGWVFFYQSRRHLETNDPIDALIGNAPLIVDRMSGQVTETGTSHPTDFYLARYEATIGAGAS